jgi:hypothetical protein
MVGTLLHYIAAASVPKAMRQGGSPGLMGTWAAYSTGTVVRCGRDALCFCSSSCVERPRHKVAGGRPGSKATSSLHCTCMYRLLDLTCVYMAAVYCTIYMYCATVPVGSSSTVHSSVTVTVRIHQRVVVHVSHARRCVCGCCMKLKQSMGLRF